MDQLSQAIFSSSQVGIFVYREDGQCIMVNETAARIVGTTRDQLLAQNFRRIESWKKSGLLEAAEATLETGEEQRREIFMTTTFGRRLSMDCRTLRVERDGEKQLLLLGLDINEQKNATEALLDSEARFRSIFDHAAVGMCLADADGRYIRVNARLAKILGRSQEELAGKHYSEVTHPEDIAADDRMMELLREGRIPSFDMEKRYLRPDGNVVWVHLTVSPHLSSGFYIAVIEDITERRLAQIALVKSEADLNEAQRMASLGSYVLEIDRGEWSSSDELREIFGLAAAASHRFEEWVEVLHPENRAEMAAYFQDEVLGQRKPFNREYRIVRKSDGETRWVHGLGTLDLDDDGRVRSMHGTIQDITGRKKTEEERERLLDELQERHQEMTRLIHSASHDLKSPLITIRLYADLMAEALREDNFDAIEKHLSRVSLASSRMIRLLEGLGEYLRLGRESFERKSVPLVGVVREAQKLLSALFQANRTNLVLKGELPVVEGDPALILRVFQNVLENASKYTRSLPAPLIEVEAFSVNGEYIVSVRDNGPGITPAHHRKIFELFERGTDDEGGTGVGLAVVWRIMRKHGGRVWVESEGNGSGTAIQLAFPRVPEAAPRAAIDLPDQLEYFL